MLDDAQHLTLHEVFVLFFTDFLALLKQSCPNSCSSAFACIFAKCWNRRDIWAEEIDPDEAAQAACVIFSPTISMRSA